MIDDFKCDAQCFADHFSEGHPFNPFEVLERGGMGCGCQLPVSMPSVVDWTTEDFYTISMVEW